MTKKWSEVVKQPEFQAMAPDQQEQARNDYFHEVVAPNVNTAVLPQVRKEFDADTMGTIGQTPAPTPPQQAPNQPSAPQAQAPAQQQPTGFMEHLQQMGAEDAANGMTAGKKLTGLTRAIGQGATFGYGDEAEAGIRSILNPGKSYDEHLGKIRTDQAEFAQKEALANTVGEIGGSLLSPLGTAGMAVKAAKGLKALGAGETLAKIGGVALPGIAQSALYGSGTAEGGLSDRLSGAKTGAITGALIGTPLAAAGAAGSKLLNLVENSPIAASVGNLMEKSSGLGQKIKAVEKVLGDLPIIGGALGSTERKGIQQGKELITGGEKAVRFEDLGKDAEAALQKSFNKTEGAAKVEYDKSQDLIRQNMNLTKEQAPNVEEAVMATPTNTYAKIDELINKPGVLAPAKRALEKIKSELEQTTQHTAQSLKDAKGVTYKALDDEKIKDPGLKKAVNDAMNEDRFDAIRAAAGDKGDEAVNLVKQGNKLHGEKMDRYEKDEDLYDLSEGKPAKVAGRLITAFQSGKKGDLDLAKKVLNEMEPADRQDFLKKAGIAQVLPPDKEWEDVTADQIKKAFDKTGLGGETSEAQQMLYGDKLQKIKEGMRIFENIGNKNEVSSKIRQAESQIGLLKGAGGLAALSGGAGAITGNDSEEKLNNSLKVGGIGLGSGLTLAALLANPRLAARTLQAIGLGSKAIPVLSGSIVRGNQGVQNNGG